MSKYISVGWIRFDPKTNKKATNKRGSSFWSRNVSTRVYATEKVAVSYCVGAEIPKEVFVQK